VARSQAQQARIASRSPARSITLSFAILCGLGTLLLMLPMMHRRRHGLRRICEKHLAAIIAENGAGSNIVALIIIDDLTR